MSPPVIGIIGLILLFILMAVRMPIGIAFLLVGGLGIATLAGADVAFSAISRIPYEWASSYVFSCVPLFIFMGMIFSKSGIASDLYKAAYSWFGRLPGGLALASLAGCGGFAAVSGSSTAGAATMAAFCYPEMKKFNYDESLASGAIAAGGTLGIMIPPSLGFIIYGIIMEQSIGKLFLAGLLPGILQIIFYFIVIVIYVKLKPNSAPKAELKLSWKDKFLCLIPIWPVIVIFVIVLGGIYLGIFTPTEAGGIGAGASLLLALLMKRFTFETFFQTCVDTINITAMIFMLFMGAMVFNIFMTLSDLPQTISVVLSSIKSPQMLVLMILIILFPLGCFLEVTSMFILTMPLFLPSLVHSHINLIWFGVLAVRCAEIALLTPPVGMNVFVVKGVIKDISVEKVFKGVIPFLISDLIMLAILFLFPKISLFIPFLMK